MTFQSVAFGEHTGNVKIWVCLFVVAVVIFKYIHLLRTSV